jgi:hypothetical protein
MVSEMKKKFESTLFVIVAVGSSLLTIGLLVAGGGYTKDSDKKQPRDPKSITASAVLLPDYTWHIADSRKISFSFDGKEFCFNENIGERVVETCGPKESLLGWRNP